ncbi:MAG: hypothetical protein ACE5EB_00515 [Thermodesulfobacteriota bacterium]
MKTPRYIVFLVIAFFTITVSLAMANSTSGNLNVSARVLPVLTKSIQSSSSSISITAADIQRGYLEVQNGTVLHVRTNSRQGYMITIEQSAFLFKEIWVFDGSRTVVMSGRSGLIHQPYSRSMRVDTKSLSYRFVLADEMKPGTYAWPLLVNAAL